MSEMENIAIKILSLDGESKDLKSGIRKAMLDSVKERVEEDSDEYKIAYSIIGCADAIEAELDMNEGQNHNLYSSLAKAQAEYTAAELDSTNPHFKSKFSSYMAHVKSSRAALAKNGISITHIPTVKDNKVTVVTRMLHESGESIESVQEKTLQPNRHGKITHHDEGSTISYYKRFAYSAMAGTFSGEEEDDGNIQSIEPPPQPAPKFNPAEVDKQLRYLRSSETVEELEKRWREIPYRDNFVEECAILKEKLLKRTKASDGSWAAINRKAHAVASERIPHHHNHTILQQLANVESLTELSVEAYSDLVEKIEKFSLSEDISEDTKRGCKELMRLDLKDKEKFWEEAILPSWHKFPIADRVHLLEARDGETS